MKKRLLTLFLVLTLLASMAVPALAAEYSDLAGHWSEPYITELTKLGYLTGYTDGTVKPDKTITACEALVLLSRFYPVDDATAQWVHEDYGTFVETYIDPSLSWAYSNIEVCLAAGILSQNELKNLRLTSPIDKELLSVLLVRALKLTDEAAKANEEGVKLTFDDTEDIAEAYRGHVAVLVNAGIIEGNNKNQFTPHASVTRGVVAAMVVRGLDYVKEQNKTLVLEDYTNFAKRTGVITAVSGNTLTLRDENGISRRYTIPTTASVTVGSQSVTLSATYVNCYVTLRVENSTVTAVTIRNEEGVSFTQGALTSITQASGGYNLYIRDLDTGKSTRHLVSSSTSTTINGETKTVADLKTGMFLTATLKGDQISSISAASGDFTMSAKITSLTYGATVALGLSSSDGSTIEYLLDLTDLPTIKRGSNEVSIERLNVGDDVTLTIKNSVLTEIAATANENTLDGTLSSIVATTSGTTWIITDSNGSNHSLVLSNTASAYQGSKSILPSVIQVGDTVSVVAEGDVISVIYLKSAVSDTATKLSGTVLVVDNATRQITVLNSAGKLVYIQVPTSASVIDATTGTLALSKIEPNSQLVAYGSYSDASNFAATSVIIEG